MPLMIKQCVFVMLIFILCIPMQAKWVPDLWSMNARGVRLGVGVDQGVIHWNPAGGVLLEDRVLGIDYAIGSDSNSLGFDLVFTGVDFLGFSGGFFGFGYIQGVRQELFPSGFDDDGQYSKNSFSVGVSYGFGLLDNLLGGITLKRISHKHNLTADNAVEWYSNFVDLGLLSQINSSWTTGFTFRNFIEFDQQWISFLPKKVQHSVIWGNKFNFEWLGKSIALGLDYDFMQSSIEGGIVARIDTLWNVNVAYQQDNLLVGGLLTWGATAISYEFGGGSLSDSRQNVSVSRKFGVHDNEPPEIVIHSPILRGLKIKQKRSSLVIRGQAFDDISLAMVMVNNKATDFDSEGYFYARVNLHRGENKIAIKAMDIYDNVASKELLVDYESVGVEVTLVEQLSEQRYSALVIGNNKYQHLNSLITAHNDAKAVARILNNEYGFRTKLLLDATRGEILEALNTYRKQLYADDNLLLYYAGHGEFEELTGKSFWLPVDAERDNAKNWIMADTITNALKRIEAKHVLLVVDSCYSGTMVRSGEVKLSPSEQKKIFLSKMLYRPSRTLIASGGNEPVLDQGGGSHSIFASYFLKGLEDAEDDVFSAEGLFYEHIKESVVGHAEQVPEYRIIRNSGHDGGDFVFRRVQD